MLLLLRGSLRQFADFLVRGLQEVFVPKAGLPKGCRRNGAHDLINFAAKLLARYCGRNRDCY
jgi:hypothetical protein